MARLGRNVGEVSTANFLAGLSPRRLTGAKTDAQEAMISGKAWASHAVLLCGGNGVSRTRVYSSGRDGVFTTCVFSIGNDGVFTTCVSPS